MSVDFCVHRAATFPDVLVTASVFTDVLLRENSLVKVEASSRKDG